MRTVLVVEKDQVVRGLVRAILVSEKYGVLEASNGADALKLAQAGGVDAIVLDCMGPGLDGLETCKLLRADVRTMGIPVIAMAGLGQHSIQLGMWANSILIKPFRPAQLLMKLQGMARPNAEAVPQVPAEMAVTSETVTA